MSRRHPLGRGASTNVLSGMIDPACSPHLSFSYMLQLQGEFLRVGGFLPDSAIPAAAQDHLTAVPFRLAAWHAETIFNFELNNSSALAVAQLFFAATSIIYAEDARIWNEGKIAFTLSGSGSI
ncbi:hypothetical protein BS78_10G134500 [Paspalum vaginatum]|nr:hypothetical protein BS78_10G134500 [Paspalum vaginatum]